MWWPLPLLALSGLLVALAIRYLPGTGGHSPADGFKSSGPVPPIELPGIVIAAFATLSLGAVLGPEAPLIAIGSGLGVLAVHLIKRDAPAQASMVIGAAGSFAAISTLLGSPIVGAFLMMEVSGLGGALAGSRAGPGSARRRRRLAHLRRAGRLDRLRDVFARRPEHSARRLARRRRVPLGARDRRRRSRCWPLRSAPSPSFSGPSWNAGCCSSHQSSGSRSGGWRSPSPRDRTGAPRRCSSPARMHFRR